MTNKIIFSDSRKNPVKTNRYLIYSELNFEHIGLSQRARQRLPKHPKENYLSEKHPMFVTGRDLKWDEEEIADSLNE